MQDLARTRVGSVAPGDAGNSGGAAATRGQRDEHCRTAIHLTPREAEVLRWVSVGKSDWQIGQILSISAKTANYHVENMKRKFGVSTRTQAVLEAARRGQLR